MGIRPASDAPCTALPFATHDYKTRQAAAARLVSLGDLAKPKIEELAKSPKPDIAQRAKAAKA